MSGLTPRAEASVTKDALAALAVGHFIASYVVMIGWVVILRPADDRVLWTVFVVGAPGAVPFFAVLCAIFGIARGDEWAFGGIAIAYAVVLLAVTIAIYRRRRSRSAIAA